MPGTMTGAMKTPVANQDEVTLFREMYSKNFIEKAGNEPFLLEGFMLSEPCDPMMTEMWVDGDEPLGTGDTPAARAARNSATSYTDMQFLKRKVVPSPLEKAVLLQRAEAKSQLANPKSRYIKRTLDWFNERQLYDFIAAALGTAVEGYYNTSRAWTTSNKTIAADGYTVADSNKAGFTFDMFLEVEKQFRDNKVGIDTVPWYMILSTTAWKQLKSTAEFKNELNRVDHPLRQGTKIPQYNNCSFFVSSLINTETANGSTVSMNIAATVDGMIRVVEDEWDIDLTTSTAYCHNLSLYMKRSVGFTRLDEKKVFKVQSVDSPTSGARAKVAS